MQNFLTTLNIPSNTFESRFNSLEKTISDKISTREQGLSESGYKVPAFPRQEPDEIRPVGGPQIQQNYDDFLLKIRNMAETDPEGAKQYYNQFIDMFEFED